MSRYTLCLDLNEKAERDVSSLDTDYLIKKSDINSKYLTLALSKQINQSAEQFDKTVRDSSDQFRLAMFFSGASLFVAIVSLWKTRKSDNQLKTSIDHLVVEIGKLSESIQTIQRPHLCLLEGLFRRIFK
jgi:hypothetical protein